MHVANEHVYKVDFLSGIFLKRKWANEQTTWLKNRIFKTNCWNAEERTNERTHAQTNKRTKVRLVDIFLEKLSYRSNAHTHKHSYARTLIRTNAQTSKKVKVSQLFVLRINLLQNSGNLSKGLNLQFFLFPYILVFFIFVLASFFTGLQTVQYFFFLYWFTNRAIFFQSKEEWNYSPVCQMEFYVIVLWNLRWVE